MQLETGDIGYGQEPCLGGAQQEGNTMAKPRLLRRTALACALLLTLLACGEADESRRPRCGGCRQARAADRCADRRLGRSAAGNGRHDPPSRPWLRPGKGRQRPVQAHGYFGSILLAHLQQLKPLKITFRRNLDMVLKSL